MHLKAPILLIITAWIARAVSVVSLEKGVTDQIVNSKKDRAEAVEKPPLQGEPPRDRIARAASRHSSELTFLDT